MGKIYDCDNIILGIGDTINDILLEILFEAKPNSSIYFESCVEEWSVDHEEDELPTSVSGLKIYISKEDYENKNYFICIRTSCYGTGGIYSYRSVHRCGLMHRFNKFIFNELKECHKLHQQNELCRLTSSKFDNIPMQAIKNVGQNINFVLIPLTLEQEENLFLRNKYVDRYKD